MHLVAEVAAHSVVMEEVQLAGAAYFQKAIASGNKTRPIKHKAQ